MSVETRKPTYSSLVATEHAETDGDTGNKMYKLAYDNVEEYFANSDSNSPQYQAVADYAEELRRKSDRDLLNYQFNKLSKNTDLFRYKNEKKDIAKNLKNTQDRIRENCENPKYLRARETFIWKFMPTLEKAEKSRIPHPLQKGNGSEGRFKVLQPLLVKNNIGYNLGKLFPVRTS